LIPIDTIAGAEFLIRHMYLPIELGNGQGRFAIAETALPIEGDRWFWTDDNAKVLEFLSRPELWRRFPHQTAEILWFVRAMCRGPLVFRRVSPPRLEPVAGLGAIGSYRHSLMNVKCDLARGAVVAGLRFHDERNGDHLLLTGNYVEFTHRRRRFRLSVEPAISDVDAKQDRHTLRLRHSSDLHFKSGWRSLRLGRITYAYMIDARSMFIEIEVTLEIEPGVEAIDVVLTVGHDQPSDMYYRTIVGDIAPTAGPLFRAGIPGRRLRNVAGVSYYMIRQPHISGDCFAVHSMARDLARPSEIETVVRGWGCLDRVVARYSFPGSQYGAHLVVRERKLLTGGGFYDRMADYAALMRNAGSTVSTQQAVWDLSTSYDYGSKINAFAKCFAVCKAEEGPTGGPDLDELRYIFDSYLNYYIELFVNPHKKQRNAIFSRDLAFVILGLVTMYRATKANDYLRCLSRLCDILLEFEVPSHDFTGVPASGFLSRLNEIRVAYVDCHSAALLALTQAVRYLDRPRFIAAIKRGLASYSTVTTGWPCEINTVSTSVVNRHGTRRVDTSFWNFKAGMTLRFFAALRKSSHPWLRSVVARHRARMDLCETVLRRQLARSITQREDSIEIRTAVSARETNSETQPWVMLGLFGHPWD
jgi:hypothetical protein